jgi:hypothetical protein
MGSIPVAATEINKAASWKMERLFWFDKYPLHLVFTYLPCHSNQYADHPQCVQEDLLLPVWSNHKILQQTSHGRNILGGTSNSLCCT